MKVANLVYRETIHLILLSCEVIDTRAYRCISTIL